MPLVIFSVYFIDYTAEKNKNEAKVNGERLPSNTKRSDKATENQNKTTQKPQANKKNPNPNQLLNCSKTKLLTFKRNELKSTGNTEF